MVMSSVLVRHGVTSLIPCIVHATTYYYVAILIIIQLLVKCRMVFIYEYTEERQALVFVSICACPFLELRAHSCHPPRVHNILLGHTGMKYLTRPHWNERAYVIE